MLEIFQEQFWIVRGILWDLHIQQRKHITGEEDWPWEQGTSNSWATEASRRMIHVTAFQKCNRVFTDIRFGVPAPDEELLLTKFVVSNCGAA
jgi:hypothetical protein